MSFPVDYACLTRADKARIQKDLTIVRPAEGPPRRDRFGGTIEPVPPPPFPFYAISPDHGEIALPLAYFTRTFGADLEGESFGAAARIDVTPLIPPRDAQVSVIAEALAHLRATGGVLIKMPPGFGKTITSLMIGAALGLKMAVISPRSILDTQWKASAHDVFGPGFDVFNLPPASAMRKSTPARIAAAGMLTALQTRSAVPDYRDLLKSVGTLIIDESHMACTEQMVAALMAYTPRYVIALSATPFRNDAADSMITHIVGDAIVERESSRDYIVYTVSTGVLIPETRSPATGMFNYTEYETDLSNSAEYNAAIVELIVSQPARKFIALFTRAAHAEAVSDMLTERGITSAAMTRARKSYTDCRALCGTFNKISTGFDAKAFSTGFDGMNPDAVIFANTVKTYQRFEQCAGRGMRANAGVTPAVFWMLTDNKVAKRHLGGLKKHIKATCGRIEPWAPAAPAEAAACYAEAASETSQRPSDQDDCEDTGECE
jgi:superfamily II DNA or RNA helicase